MNVTQQKKHDTEALIQRLQESLRGMPPGRYRSACESQIERLRNKVKHLSELLAGGSR